MAASGRGSQLPRSLGPAAAVLRDQLLAEISSGKLAPGQRLGAEREIAERFGVSRSTVRTALTDLARSGAIRRAHDQPQPQAGLAVAAVPRRVAAGRDRAHAGPGCRRPAEPFTDIDHALNMLEAP